MEVWEEYRDSGWERRWRNSYGDEVWVQNMMCTDTAIVHIEEQYQTRYKPARSDIVTTVPNGRFDTFAGAVTYATDVVMGRGRVVSLAEQLADQESAEKRTPYDQYLYQASMGEFVDPGLFEN